MLVCIGFHWLKKPGPFNSCIVHILYIIGVIILVVHIKDFSYIGSSDFTVLHANDSTLYDTNDSAVKICDQILCFDPSILDVKSYHKRVKTILS